jgi:hypothetical protein
MQKTAVERLGAVGLILMVLTQIDRVLGENIT